MKVRSVAEPGRFRNRNISPNFPKPRWLRFATARVDGLSKMGYSEKRARANLPTRPRAVYQSIGYRGSRSHALRGNAVLDAPRPYLFPLRNDAERRRRHSHAERGNEVKRSHHAGKPLYLMDFHGLA